MCNYKCMEQHILSLLRQAACYWNLFLAGTMYQIELFPYWHREATHFL